MAVLKEESSIPDMSKACTCWYESIGEHMGLL